MTTHTATTIAETYVARALTKVHPSKREAVLIAAMRAAAIGIRQIHGAEHASEEAYRLADELAVRG